MKTVDASTWHPQHFFQAASLVIITEEPLTLRCNLQESVHALLLQFEKLGLHLTTTDGGIIFTPTQKPLVRTLTVEIPEELTSTQVLGGLLPLLLFSNIQLQLLLNGRTHAPKEATMSWYHELLFRYVRKYLNTYSIGVSKASLQTDGVIDIKVASKQKLSRVIPDLNIVPQDELSHFVVELIAKTGDELEFQEKLLRLAYSKFGAPVRYVTRIAPFYAFTQLAFFGSHEGYDNDAAFLQGSFFVGKEKLTQQIQLDLLHSFEKKLSSTILADEEAWILLPIVALTGGSLPLEATRQDFAPYLTFLSDYLMIDFYMSEDLLETEGYAKLHSPELVELEDL